MVMASSSLGLLGALDASMASLTDTHLYPPRLRALQPFLQSPTPTMGLTILYCCAPPPPHSLPTMGPPLRPLPAPLPMPVTSSSLSSTSSLNPLSHYNNAISRWNGAMIDPTSSTFLFVSLFVPLFALFNAYAVLLIIRDAILPQWAIVIYGGFAIGAAKGTPMYWVSRRNAFAWREYRRLATMMEVKEEQGGRDEKAVVTGAIGKAEEAVQKSGQHVPGAKEDHQGDKAGRGGD
jgi:hypothetical protein